MGGEIKEIIKNKERESKRCNKWCYEIKERDKYRK